MAAVRYRLGSLLRSGWRTTLGITLVVAIAGGLALTLVAGALRTLSAPDRYVDSQADVFDAEVQQQEQSGPPRGEDLRRLPAARHVETATFVFGGLLGPGSSPLSEDLVVFAGSATAIGERVGEGRAPASDRPNEFVLARSVFDSAKLKLGDHFRLVTFNAAQAKAKGFEAGEPEGLRLDATLVGVLDGPAQLQDGSAVAVFPGSLLNAGDVGTAITVASVGLAPGATIQDLRSQIANLPDGQVFGVEAANPISHATRTAVSAQGQGLAVLALVAAGATIVVIGQLLSRQYWRSEPERMVLSSLGFTRTQLIAEPVAQAAIAVVTGTLAATVLAYLWSGLFPRGFVKLIEPDPGRLFDPIAHVLGPVVLVVALLGWVLLSLLVSARETEPVRDIRLVDRLAPGIPSVTTGLGLHFALGRSPGRARAARVPFIGLILIVGLVFGALTFGRNLGLVVGVPDRYGVNYDLELGQGGEITRADVRPLLDNPTLSRDIAGVTLYGSLKLAAGRASLYIIGMDPLRGHLVPEVLTGRLPERSDEIAIGRVSARKLGVGTGDTIKLSTKAGPKVVKVTGTVQPPPVSGADVVGDAGVVTNAGFRRVAPHQPKDTAVIDLAPGAPADTSRRIRRRDRAAVRTPQPAAGGHQHPTGEKHPVPRRGAGRSVRHAEPGSPAARRGAPATPRSGRPPRPRRQPQRRHGGHPRPSDDRHGRRAPRRHPAGHCPRIDDLSAVHRPHRRPHRSRRAIRLGAGGGGRLARARQPGGRRARPTGPPLLPQPNPGQAVRPEA